ncbi:alpha/beta hydrolase [Cupriavidus sp. CV2]|uniref:alpha/beta hydrolase n=1 Tax=Cupriavidus ulmosensis TaxID=3065913 RepID=UPI00296AFEDC|nr:alpha/beta hydrolase [Cupriavidus sp. CV2]MDW3682084.1 alpha/beta hydrolase [Cupriavidus sp. CV2]
MAQKASKASSSTSSVHVDSVSIIGHAQRIPLRVYVPDGITEALPVILYLHGGGFVEGNLDWAEVAASTLARATSAVVVAVGYSLSPRFPFPVPLEDGYLAALWTQANARQYGIDARRMGIAGHDAGGNLAAGISAMARDRKDFTLRAQALLAPLLDPSMTRLADIARLHDVDLSASDCAMAYRAYLPDVLQQLHPYVAPLESRRLSRLPPTLIVSAAQDVCHIEAETYASELIAAGVPTETTRYAEASHCSIATHAPALADVAAFFARRLDASKSAPVPRRPQRPQRPPESHQSEYPANPTNLRDPK